MEQVIIPTVLISTGCLIVIWVGGVLFTFSQTLGHPNKRERENREYRMKFIAVSESKGGK